MNTNMPSNPPERVCPICGTPLPAQLPPEQCPKCLLQAGLPTEPCPPAQPTSTATHLPRQSWPGAGDHFGHYQIVRLLGQGGMGAVFEAEDMENGRRVALKVLGHSLDSPEARQRFLREGRLAASINHPNSVYVFGTEEIGGTPVIAMELVGGGNLQERVSRDGPLPAPKAVDAILQVIDGLEAARVLGILHRDVKPSNCFEDIDGTIKIGDFGLSISTVGMDLNITTHGALLGTPAFSSPEQLRGQELSARSDLYAVGVTLFYLLTGRTPFQGPDMVQLIANVLEQPAPSPKKFQPSLPQELAKAVLRCLEKNPGDRFKDYSELRQALAPFGSAAPTAAPLGLRFVAGALDMFFVSLGGMIVSLIVFGGVVPFTEVATAGTLKMLALVMSAFTMVILYYTILEGRWGASVGKRLCRLRVAGSDRNPPGFAKAMLRASVFVILPAVPGWVSFGIDPIRVLSSGSFVNQYAVSALNYLILGLLFSTARRRNGYAAVHDLLTGTRVIRKMAYQSRPVSQPSTEAPPPAENQPAVGPYHVLGTLGSSAAGDWLLGFDTRLLRKVWLHLLPPGTPPAAPSLRNIGRVGRLRWIAGRRAQEENWDAYEGVTGHALPDLIRTPQPWTHVRFWLLDLAVELSAAESTATLPEDLTLDRVWITADGRAKLLDFPAPGLAPGDGDAPVSSEAIAPKFAAGSEGEGLTTRASSGPAEDGDRSGAVPPVLARSPRKATLFLNAVAHAGIHGLPLPQATRETGRISVPLPLHARDFLEKLPELPGATAVSAALQPLVHQVATVSRGRRLGLIAGCAVVPFIAGIGSFFGVQMLQNWNSKQPDIFALNQLLAVRSTHRMLWSKPSDSFSDEKIAIYIASHYRSTITDSNQWLSLYALSMVQGANRKFAEQSLVDYPNPAEEQILEAEDAIDPILQTLQTHNFTQKPWFPFLAFGSSWIAYVAMPALFAALLFRGGLVLRALRVAIVRRDGRPASRLRVLFRAIVSWSPVLLSPFVFFALKPLLGITLAAIAVAAAVAGLALCSLLLPGQGVQDRLARTCLVPR